MRLIKRKPRQKPTGSTIFSTRYSKCRRTPSSCHQPGCWRIGTHPAAGGQFLLCYRHHPDYQGKKPTRELIEQAHRQYIEREEAIHDKLDEMNRHLREMGHQP